MRWTSKGKCEAFVKTSVAKVRLAPSPLIRQTIYKVTFLTTYWSLTFKLEMLKGFIVFRTGDLICIMKIRYDTYI